MMCNETPKLSGLKPPACVMLTDFVGEEFGQSAKWKAFLLHNVSAAHAGRQLMSPARPGLDPFRGFSTQTEGHGSPL